MVQAGENALKRLLLLTFDQKAAMWNCSRCFEEIDESFEVCWNCGTDRSGNIDESFETADAPLDEPIAVDAIDLQRAHYPSLIVHNLNYGLGSMAGPLMWTFAICVAAIAVYFRLDPAQAAAKPYLLAILTFMLLLGCGKTLHAMATSVLRVEIGREFIVCRMWGTTIYPLNVIESLEFEHEFRMSLWATLLRGPQRIVTFVLRDERDVRLAIDANFEKQLREVIRAAS